MVDKVALGQVFSEYYGANSHSTGCCEIIIIYHPGLLQ
jgi:hypothetical protein